MNPTIEARSTGLKQLESDKAVTVADPRRWQALLVLLLAAFMDLTDNTIVNVALPSIQRDLAAGYAAVQWVVAGYALAFGVLLITGGRMGDIFGRKRMFLAGVAGFTIASLLCGFSQSQEMLIVSRFLQGAMAALMVPQVLAIVQVIFPPRERGAAFGIYGAVTGLAAVSGPLLGGLLIEANLFSMEWRSVFLVNLPIGIATLIAAAVILREQRSPHAPRLDPVGVALVTVALLALLYPLVQGRELGWSAWSFWLMLASLPLFIAFALYERRKTRLDNSPLVVLDLFRRRTFVAGLLVGLCFFAGIGSFFLVLALCLQIGLGFSALSAGLAIVPFSVAGAIGSAASVQVAPRIGRRVLSLGTLLISAGMLGVALTMRAAGTELTGWDLVPALFVSGVGMGLVIPPLADIILAGVPDEAAGSASGVLSTTMQLGTTVGIVVIGLLFFGLLSSHAVSSAREVAPRITAGLQAAGVPQTYQQQIIEGFTACFSDRMSEQDPSVVPPSCRYQQTPGQEQVQSIVGAAATQAVRRNFTAAASDTAWYEVGLFLLTFLLVFLLPRRPRPVEHATA